MTSYLLQAKVLSPGGSTASVLARRLELVTEAVTQRYSDVLLFPIELLDGENFICKITVGDENNLEKSGRIVEMICELTLRLTPVKCRFALAQNERDLEIAFDEAHRNRLFFAARGFDAMSNSSLTGAIAAIGGLLWDWTERQSQFVRALLRDGVVCVDADKQLQFVKERKRRELSTFFKVSPSVITECLQAANVKRFRYQVYTATVLFYKIAARSPVSH
ncbi:MAG: hypothetical protein QGF46_01285 [Planctomycetota bacterium]|jgi:hypothetical protein|nr:hypothetical protein [Planctomycetota bacterium]